MILKRKFLRRQQTEAVKSKVIKLGYILVRSKAYSLQLSVI